MTTRHAHWVRRNGETSAGGIPFGHDQSGAEKGKEENLTVTRQTQETGKGKSKEDKNKSKPSQANMDPRSLPCQLFLGSGKHVTIRESLMAGHAHDIRLDVRRKRLNLIRKEFTVFLSFRPMRTICIEIVHQAIFVSESKCITSVVLPSDVQKMGPSSGPKYTKCVD